MAESSSNALMSPLISEDTVPEVLSKALVEAQEEYKAALKEEEAVIKKAKDDHSAAVSHGCMISTIQTHMDAMVCDNIKFTFRFYGTLKV